MEVGARGSRGSRAFVNGARCAAAIFVVVAALEMIGAAAAQESDYLTLGAGVFDLDDDAEAVEGRIEYQSGRRLFADNFGERFNGIGPKIGLYGNADGGVFGYFALFIDLRLTDRVVLLPFTGFGGYREGDSRDLGGVFQFHSGAELAYRFDNDHRLGVTFAHVSNASIHDRNPGENSLLVTYSVPVGFLF